MSEFGVSGLEWGTELPLSALWKPCPLHTPPLKHSYGKIIFTNLEPIGSNCWKQQCEGVCEAAVTEFQRISQGHCSSQDSTQPCLAVGSAESSSQNILQAGSNSLREHFQPAQDNRGRPVEILSCADIPAVFQRIWSAEVSLRSPGGQNKEYWVVALYFTS